MPGYFNNRIVSIFCFLKPKRIHSSENLVLDVLSVYNHSLVLGASVATEVESMLWESQRIVLQWFLEAPSAGISIF